MHPSPLTPPLPLALPLLLALLCALSACPGPRAPEGAPGAGGEGAEVPCARVGDRCRLKGSALGVCSPGAGEGLQCTPQH